MLCKNCEKVTELKVHHLVETHIPDRADVLAASRAGCPTCYLIAEHWDDSIVLTREYEGGPGENIAEWFVSESEVRCFVKNSKMPWVKDGVLVSLPLVSLNESDASQGSQWLESGIFKDRASLEAMGLAKRWVSECQSGHKSCALSSKSALPRRVLDVMPQGIPTESPRLKISPVDIDKRESAPFAVLSYCWGVGNRLLTTTKNIEQHCTGIPLEIFPQSLQDAIFVTRSLGLRYLWIDSICIVQDDPLDWTEQSMDMASIYGRCFVAISGTASPDASIGWLESSAAHNEPVMLSRQAGNDETGSKVNTYMIPAVRSWDFNIDYAPISARGWTLQERLLPCRVLHFGPQQMAFECLSHAVTEIQSMKYHGLSEFELHLKTLDSLTGMQLSRKASKAYSESLKSLKASLYDDKAPLPVDKFFYEDADAVHCNSLEERTLLRWYEILRVYTRRSVTKEQDKLFAILGIIFVFDERLRSFLPQTPDIWGRMLAGIWANDVVRGLCWYVEDGQHSSRAASFRAPSWSWACLDGPIVFPNELILEKVAVVDKIDVMMSEDLTCRGTLCLQTKTGQFKGTSALRSWADEEKLRVAWDDSPEQPQDEGMFTVAYVAILWRNVATEYDDIMRNYSIFCVILQKLDREKGTFQRVGCAHSTNPWRSSISTEGWSLEHIRIV